MTTQNMTGEVSPDITFIDFLLDETGSMSSCAAATKSGFDQFVTSQQSGNQCFLTLAKFDSTGVRVPYENLDINMVPKLSFFPGSMTNLFDCIGTRLQSVLDQQREGKSLFVILTDGGDNASVKYTRDSVRSLIEKAMSNNVSVVYMGPSSNAHQVGELMGIPHGNIFPFETSEMAQTMDTLTVATRAFRAGETTTGSFFS